MQTNETKEKMKTRIQEIGESIERIYDTVELKAHLGRMELEKGLEQVRPQMQVLTEEIEGMAGDVRDRLRLKMKNLQQRLNDLESRQRASWS